MLAFVRAMRRRPEECERSIEPVLFIIFIHSLIVHFETAPPKSPWIFAGPSPFSYLVFTAFCKSLLFIFSQIYPEQLITSIIYVLVENIQRHLLITNSI